MSRHKSFLYFNFLNFRLLAVAVIAFSLISFPSLAGDKKEIISGEEIHSQLLKGTKLYYQNQYNQSIEALSRIIANKPDPKILYSALVHRGAARGYLGQKEEALEDFETALRLDARDPFLYYMRATTVFSAKKELDRAIEDFNYAFTLSPDRSLALSIYLSRSDCYAQRKEFELARNDLNQALRLDPQRTRNFLLQQGAGSYYQNQYAQAIWTLSQLIDHKPDLRVLYPALIHRGSARGYLGEKVKALQDFDAALQINNRDPFLYYMRSVTVFANQKEFARAIEDLNYAFTLHPNSSLTLSLYLSRSDCYAQKKEFSAAREDLNHALRLDPNNKSIFATMNNLANLYSATGDMFRRKGQYDQALRYYSEALLLTSQNPRPFAGRAFVRILQGDKKNAFSDLQAACNLGHQNACHILERLGE